MVTQGMVRMANQVKQYHIINTSKEISSALTLKKTQLHYIRERQIKGV
jgi:hypothetical protein